jgi:hypothetical protein
MNHLKGGINAIKYYDFQYIRRRTMRCCHAAARVFEQGDAR